MSEISYYLDILIRDEKVAAEFSEKLKSEIENFNYSLVPLVNSLCGCDFDFQGYQYSIESLKTFSNEIQLSCYSGRSEPPFDIVEAIASVGNSDIYLSVFSDDEGGPEHYYFVGGEKSTKKCYQASLKEFKVADQTSNLQEFLYNENFKKAESIIDECDLAKLEPEDDYIQELICSHEYTGLAVKLLKAGLFDNGHSLYEDPWIETVITDGSTELLKNFIDYGFNPLELNERGSSVFHHCVCEHGLNSTANLQYLLELYPDQINLVLDSGSPLWYGFDRGGNIPSCFLLESKGAKLIPPIGYYDDMETSEIIKQAIKHRDEATFHSYYTSDYFDLSVYYALDFKSFPILLWLSSQKEIDWCASLSGNLSLEDDLERFVASHNLYEIPVWSGIGSSCDHRVISFLIEKLKGRSDCLNKLAIYVVKFEDFPESKQLLEELMSAGADFSVWVLIGDLEECALQAAMLSSNYDCFEYLLSQGAFIPEKSGEEDEDLKSSIERYFSGKEKKIFLEILEKNN